MDIIEIAKNIEKKNGRLYLVGGAIRDKIIGIENYDEDYCVVGLSDNDFEEMFPNAKKYGKSFGVYGIDGKEFALARMEEKIDKGHKGFNIISNKDISIEEDLRRRDVTINSIAQDVLTGEIIDPFNGMKDIENKTIRATSEKFIEDPLRVYRVARLASKLNFEVDKDTISLMNFLREELKTLSPERVFEEFRKVLNTDNPSKFFLILKESNVLDVHFKEIYRLIGALQPLKYHPEGDSFNHTMMALENSVKLTKDEKLRFAALVHDLGKGTTPKEMYPHHYGHEERGYKEVKNLGERLRIPKTWVEIGQEACLYHMKGGIFDRMTINKKVQFIEKVNDTKIGLEGLKIVVLCDRNRSENIDTSIVDFDIIGKEMINTINGKYILNKYREVKDTNFKDILHLERVEWLKNK